VRGAHGDEEPEFKKQSKYAVDEDRVRKLFLEDPKRRNFGAHESVAAFTKFEEIPRQARGKVAPKQLYGIYLREKQKMKYFYGRMLERRFQRYVMEVQDMKGDKAANLMRELELRADTLLFRSGFVNSFQQSHGLFFQKHVRLNGGPLEQPSKRLHVGDVLHIHPNAWEDVGHLALKHVELKRKFGGRAGWVDSPAGMLPYLEINRKILALIVVREPTDDEMLDMRQSCWLPYTQNMRLRPDYALAFFGYRRHYFHTRNERVARQRGY